MRDDYGAYPIGEKTIILDSSLIGRAIDSARLRLTNEYGFRVTAT